MVRFLLLLLATLAPLSSAQLRPRRVGGAGVNAMGQQEDVPAGEGMDNDLADLASQLGSGGLGGGNMDMAKMMESLTGGDLSKLMDNPMLKGLAEASPELAEMLNDPDAMKQKMEEVAQLLNSEEGQGMAAKMMQEMQNVMTDPEKLQQGLQQLVENPALKGLADSVPGLSEALSDPDTMRAQAEKTAELFQKMQDPEQMQQMLEAMGGAEGLQEQMAKMMGAMGANGDNDAMAQMLSGMAGGDGAAEGLKERVDRLMRGARNGDDAVELDEF